MISQYGFRFKLIAMIFGIFLTYKFSQYSKKADEIYRSVGSCNIIKSITFSSYFDVIKKISASII